MIFSAPPNATPDESPAALLNAARQVMAWSVAEDQSLRQTCRERIQSLRRIYSRTPAPRRAELFPPEVIHSLQKSTALLDGPPDSSLRELLHSLFGYQRFRSGQEEIIRTVLAGVDCLAVMPTGSGKSLTFQIPARRLGGTTLVISPLIALMKDQVDSLAARGMRATYLNSSLDDDERRQRLSALRRGAFELIYAAPEGLEFYLASLLEGVNLRLLAVDEAHCISEWGHDFRPAYRNLAGLRQRFGGIPLLALTATATRRVQDDIVAQLGMDQPARLQASTFRPNLHLSIVKKTGDPPVGKSILKLVRSRRDQSGIVYCLTRRDAESLASMLTENGIAAESYHAGLEPDVRHQRQDNFQRDRTRVIVATVAFGMGIDKSNIRYVIHRDMPRSIESYAQEIGRAGRDDAPSDCVLFYAWPDVLAHDAFANRIEDDALSAQRREQSRRTFRFADTHTCRHQALAAWFGERMEPCGTSCDVCSGRDVLAEAASKRTRRKR